MSVGCCRGRFCAVPFVTPRTIERVTMSCAVGCREEGCNMVATQSRLESRRLRANRRRHRPPPGVLVSLEPPQVRRRHGERAMVEKRTDSFHRLAGIAPQLRCAVSHAQYEAVTDADPIPGGRGPRQQLIRDLLVSGRRDYTPPETLSSDRAPMVHVSAIKAREAHERRRERSLWWKPAPSDRLVDVRLRLSYRASVR